ncbi:MAG: L,D-transpeptidase family protein [Allorhizobium sp.]
MITPAFSTLDKRSGHSTVLVRPAPLDGRRAIVQLGPLRFAAALGRSGRTAQKREGDGATPIAALRLLYGFYRADRIERPVTALPMKPVGPSMLWCDDVSDPNYNRLVKSPFAASHERLTRDDHLYDICLVMDWNVASRRRHRGSAIFFHLARPGYLPTEGCIAISLGDMRRLLRSVRYGTVVNVG